MSHGLLASLLYSCTTDAVFSEVLDQWANRERRAYLMRCLSAVAELLVEHWLTTYNTAVRISHSSCGLAIIHWLHSGILLTCVPSRHRRCNYCFVINWVWFKKLDCWVAVTAAGFRNLCRCGHGQFDHSVYGGQNAHVLTVAVGDTAGGGQQLCRSTSSRSFTYSTKI